MGMPREMMRRAYFSFFLSLSLANSLSLSLLSVLLPPDQTIILLLVQIYPARKSRRESVSDGSQPG